jgi:hypothetical protein
LKLMGIFLKHLVYTVILRQFSRHGVKNISASNGK